MKAPSASASPALRIACSVLALAVSSAALPGCGRDPHSAAAAKLEKFEVTLDMPTPPGKATPVPPPAALEPFRVWINQEMPRQKKTPVWQSVPAKEGKVLDMAPDGNWWCLLNPVTIHGKYDEDGTVAHWTTTRTLRCSSDYWRTSVEGRVRVGYAPDGARGQADPDAVLHLRDMVAGQPRYTVVVLESMKDKTRRTF